MADSYQAIYDAVRSRISGGNIGDVVSRAAHEAFDISHAVAMTRDSFQTVAWEMQRPSVLFRPTLMADGTMWCALFGTDLQSGVAGFGDTPETAMEAFDKAWKTERTPIATAKIRAIEDEDAQRERNDNGQFGVGA